jgi:DmsE family decaheme c-type cytochrome
VVVILTAILALFMLEQGVSAQEANQAPRQYKICLDCHDGYASGLANTPHRIPLDDSGSMEPRVVCTDCHIGDARHYEDDPEEYPMGNPETADPHSQALLCSSCHQNSHQQNMLEDNVHAENDINCSGCHKVHGNTRQGLLKSAEFELCLSCHAGVEGQFAQPFRHPVNDGIVKCSECHLTLDRTARDLSLNGKNACFECHAEFRGPFPYEHQATVDYSVEEGGCLNCHNAHGSAHPRMLNQPYDSPHFQLCSQCHSVPLHNNNSFHGTQWAGMNCSECHTDIHGSYTSRNFLSESLQGQGCFNVGCHQY